MTSEQFQILDNKFIGLDKKLDNLVDFLSGQFQQIDNRFEKVDQGFDILEERMGKVENILDYMTKNMVALNQEKTIGAYRSVRIEAWVKKAAKKINLPYNA